MNLAPNQSNKDGDSTDWSWCRNGEEVTCTRPASPDAAPLLDFGQGDQRRVAVPVQRSKTQQQLDRINRRLNYALLILASLALVAAGAVAWWVMS